MSGDALRVSGLGKAYRTYRSEWRRVLSWFGVSITPVAERWVLRGVSFSVAPGEAVGIVGQNGAGKSTLLKLITGVLRASEGEALVNGRVAAILELGMGFNPEFTGRQNVYHAAGLMGFSREAIERAIPEIEAFAEIGEYFDQPVRTYSSGMQMRVTFSVATAFRPEILIVDEALAVGDAAFQRKCFRRIEEFLKEGTTLLFVTHDVATVKKICSKAIFLKEGRLVASGVAKDVCDQYEKYLFRSSSKLEPIRAEDESASFVDRSLISPTIEIAYGDENAEIGNFAIKDSRGEPANVIPEMEPFAIDYEIRFFAHCNDVHFGMMIKTVEGVCVYATNTEHVSCQKEFVAGNVAHVSFSLKNNLAPGTYYMNCGATHLTAQGRAFLHRRLDVAIFRVIERGKSSHFGLANLDAMSTVMVQAK